MTKELEIQGLHKQNVETEITGYAAIVHPGYAKSVHQYDLIRCSVDVRSGDELVA